MRKINLLIILIGTVLVLSGCVGQDNSGLAVDKLTIQVTDLNQINRALANGPVLLETGAKWCPPCRKQGTIINSLAGEYKGKATVMNIDTEESPVLSNYFNIDYMPDLCVIVGIENGQYVYMARDGTVSRQREDARFIGLTDKQTLSNTLDYAIEEYYNKYRYN
ncbi:MAG: thioredoxin [Nitrospirae bacterium]|nr:thioredoxin [Nitrospirota bacterium]